MARSLPTISSTWLGDHIHGIGVGVDRLAVLDGQIRGDLLIVGLLRDHFEIEHAAEDEIPASMQAWRLPHGERLFGFFEEAGERGALREIEVRGILAKVPARGRLRAVESGAEVNPVQVEIHDLGL